MNETARICSSSWISLPSRYIIPRFVIIFFGISSNIVLIIGLIIDPLKCFRNPSSYLIANLAINDILTCFVGILLQYWRPCVNGFDLHRLIHLPLYVAAFSIVMMAFDRYMSCVHPLKYRILITRKVTFIIILLQWLLAFGHVVFETIYMYMSWSIYSRCAIATSILLSSAIMYGNAAFVLKNNSSYLKSVSGVSSTSHNKAQHARLVNENRLLATMFLVSFITIMTITPEMVYESVIGVTYIENEHLDVSNTGRVRDTFQIWLMTLFFVNFSINPLMYTWRLKNYRETFKILLKLAF